MRVKDLLQRVGHVGPKLLHLGAVGWKPGGNIDTGMRGESAIKRGSFGSFRAYCCFLQYRAFLLNKSVKQEGFVSILQVIFLLLLILTVLFPG